MPPVPAPYGKPSPIAVQPASWAAHEVVLLPPRWYGVLALAVPPLLVNGHRLDWDDEVDGGLGDLTFSDLSAEMADVW